jgi:hypothetical protein
MGVLPEEGVSITIPPIPVSAVDVTVGSAGAVMAMTMVVGVCAAWVGALLPVGGIKGNGTLQAARIEAMHSTAKIPTRDRRFLSLIPSSKVLEPFSSSVI